MSKYDVNNIAVSSLLSSIKDGNIAIPEIQRPFVWDSTKVRDLIDSLYQNYPVGHIIVWQNPDIKLKNGTVSSGKKVLIDGQQRITALAAAIVGQEVVGADYKRHRIQIAFNPQEERFDVVNPAILKDVKYIADIAVIFDPGFNTFGFVIDYCQRNGIAGNEGMSRISDIITRLKSIENNNLGVINLSHELDIEQVTDIFIRINSKGVVLSQADFAMSKISSNEEFGGNTIRKTIDYFCHFLQVPADYNGIKSNDPAFAQTPEFRKIEWIANENEDIYEPDYNDVLRVAFTYKFSRGRLSDLVSLLSGRDFEARDFKAEIAEAAFYALHDAVLDVVNQTNFQRYVMILKSIGVERASQVRSQNVLNFGYILHLTLRARGTEPNMIEHIVRRWIVLTILTGRYSGSPESAFDYDVKRFNAYENPLDYLEQVEAGELSDAFWNNVLVDRLNTSVASSPYFNVFLMAQVKNHDKGFLGEHIEVKAMLEERGDIHHLFPKKYLIQNGITNKGQYNQIANYVYLQSEINIKISADAPKDYMAVVLQQCKTGVPVYGGIISVEQLNRNLEENCIDGETLMTTPLPPIRFIISGLLPQGLHILAGPPKVGKSWLALWLCLQVSKGEPVWGFESRQGSVLYLCLEDSYARIQKRLLDVTDDAPDNLFFSTISAKLRVGLEQQVEQFLSEHTDTVLIVIDTLQRIRGNTNDANPYASDYRDLGILKELADKNHIAVLLIHHLRKMNDDDPMNMISGTTGISGATDSNFVLRKGKRSGNSATLYCTGRDIEYRELVLEFDAQTHIWKLSPDCFLMEPEPQDEIIFSLSLRS